MPPRVEVLVNGMGEDVEILTGPGSARIAVGPSMGAAHRSMCLVELEPGTSTMVLRHPGEAVWYVVAGEGEAVAPSTGTASALDPGAMVHVGGETDYVLTASQTESLHLVGGPSPPDPDLGKYPSGAPSEGEVRLFHRDRPTLRVPMISSDARLVVFPGVGAETANMNYVRMEPGEENVPHRHEESEDTIVILSGHGTVDDLENGVSLPFDAGAVIHVPIGLEHRVKADRGSGVESVGGPCPPDRAMLRLAQQA